MKKQTNSNTKAHLIRGAFYLLLLVAVCAIPFALAQPNASKRSVAKPAAKPNLSAIAKLRQTAPPLTHVLTEASADERVLNAAIPGGVCQFHVLIVYADTEGLPTQLQSEIQAEPNVIAVDLFDATVGTPTLAQLQQYEIVVPFSNSPFLDGDTLGDNLPADLKSVLTVGPGTFQNLKLLPYPERKTVRVAFELDPGNENACEMRLILEAGGKPISETWLYRWTP